MCHRAIMQASLCTIFMQSRRIKWNLIQCGSCTCLMYINGDKNRKRRDTPIFFWGKHSRTAFIICISTVSLFRFRTLSIYLHSKSCIGISFPVSPGANNCRFGSTNCRQVASGLRVHAFRHSSNCPAMTKCIQGVNYQTGGVNYRKRGNHQGGRGDET